jgi:AcrR family transcriptional regulator
MRLIGREGVAALSTRKIARETPIRLATVHYRFGSKDDLLLAVLDAATSVMIGTRRRPMQAASAFLQQRYLDALQTCYRVACAQGELRPIACAELAAVVGTSIDGLALQAAAGVPLPQQEATRAHMLHSLLALVPAPTGPQARVDGGGATHPVHLFDEAIRSLRNE